MGNAENFFGKALAGLERSIQIEESKSIKSSSLTKQFSIINSYTELGNTLEKQADSIDDIYVLGNGLHYGDDSGNIYLCDAGGLDNNTAFECRACFSFDHLGSTGTLKTAHAIKGTWRHRAPFEAKHTIAKDYNPSFGAAPSVPVSTSSSQGKWDVSYWDQNYWADSDETCQIKEKRENISAHGETLAPQIQVTSAQSFKLDCELLSADLVYSTGAVLA